MAKKFDKSMFDRIKETINKPKMSGESRSVNVLRMKPGNTYTVRLIPDVENMDNTFFPYESTSFKSKTTGDNINNIALTSFGERDPIVNQMWKNWREWKETNPPQGAKFDNPIRTSSKVFVNVLVVDDPTTPENNGTVKVLNMGVKLADLVKEAMEGARADEFGFAIFDLSPEGADLKISVETNKGGFPNYDKSWFTYKSPLKLSSDEVEAIYEKVHNLREIWPAKTAEELTDLLNEHYLGGGSVAKSSPKKESPKPQAAPTPAVEDSDDDIPWEHPGDAARRGESSELSTEEVDQLLEGLE